MKHTKEPWAHRNGRIYQADYDVLTIANIARAFDGDYSEENGRRIVVCVNKFAGMTTGEIEQLPADVPTLLTRLSERSLELDKVTEQRDALLRLLKEIKDSGGWYSGTLEFDHNVDGEELLAKVERYIEASDK